MNLKYKKNLKYKMNLKYKINEINHASDIFLQFFFKLVFYISKSLTIYS